MNDWRPSCMGGWCHLREVCQRYIDGNKRWKPVERLCSKNGQEHFIRIEVVRAAA